MPRVSEEYRENKYNQLLDDAQRVCNRKCIYDITMRDIIKESGISQGGIYCFFSDIDDVLVSLMNRFTKQSNFKEETHHILQSSLMPEQKVKKLCEYLREYTIFTIENYGKYVYELNFLYLHHQERFLKVQGKLEEQKVLAQFKAEILHFLKESTKAGYFYPIKKLEEIMNYINASYEGILSYLNITYYYNKIEIKGDIVTQFDILEKTILFLLGVPR